VNLVLWLILWCTLPPVSILARDATVPQGDLSGDPPALSTQEKSLTDPNHPSQAPGLKSVQGRIVKSDDKTHIVRQPTGGDTTIVVDERTKGDKDLRPGDLITGTVTSQGLAVVVKKETRGE